jgi:hypothetical protein
LNTYLYVGGNPISRIDPTGEQWGVLAVALGAYGAWHLYTSYQISKAANESAALAQQAYVAASLAWSSQDLVDRS